MADVNVLEYIAPWPLYALAWSSSSLPHNVASSSRWSGHGRSGSSSSLASAGIPRDARLAVGSFVDEYTNRIQVLGVASDKYGQPCLKPVADAAHPYPASRIGFQPSTLQDPLGSSSSSGPRHSTSSAKSAKSRSSWGSQGVQSAEDLDEEVRYPDRELLATTADCLRIWECTRDEDSEESSGYVGSNDPGSRHPFALREKSVLAYSKNTNTTSAPLTSFSWNTPSPNLIVTSSIDTTCTIWDLQTRTALRQLIAHDREVYDVDWCPGSADVFASVSADGSVRVFDLRALDYSTIIYETGGPAPTSGGNNGDDSRPGSGMSNDTLVSPLLKIAFNPWDANYLATFHLDADSVQILDVRAPGSPILELRGHQGAINAVAWGPPGTGLGTSGSGASKGMICTAGDDSQCLVYDLASSTLRSASAQGRRSRNGAGPSPAPSSDSRSSVATSIGAEVPALAYTASEMVNNVSWLRLPTAGQSSGTSSRDSLGVGGTNGKAGITQEWSDYTSNAKSRARAGPDVDWLALVSGRSVRALRV